MNKKIKHLEFIQDVVKRMAINSFLLKFFTVVLTVSILAFNDQSVETWKRLVWLVPILAFWLLDAYYLRVERLYRLLYDDVRNKKEEEIDFSLAPLAFDRHREKFASSFLSRTELCFYLPLLLTLGTILR